MSKCPQPEQVLLPEGTVMDDPTRERGERRFLLGQKTGVSAPQL